MPSEDHRVDWADVDGDAEAAADYLDAATGLDAIREAKRRSHRLLRPTAGDRVLDVGCGIGDDVRAIAELVEPGGSAIGLDRSPSLVATARGRTPASTAARFVVGDGLQLPFGTDGMDASRADRVLQHLAAPRQLLDELYRVTRLGGRVAVTDPDWNTCVIAGPDLDDDLTRELTDGRWAGAVDPSMGRRLYPLFRDAGFRNVEVDAVTATFTDFETVNELLSLEERLERLSAAGRCSEVQVEEWLAGARRADRRDRLFCSMTGFTVAGTVPDEP